jgi:virginiamycin B lyase
VPGKLFVASLLAIATLASLVGATASARATHRSARGGWLAVCAHGSVPARIGGKRVCLRAGQRCKKRYERQYRHHGFHCQSGRLRRLHKPPPPPPPAPPAGQIAATIPIGHPVGAIAAGEGAIWVANGDATVSRIDPATNTVVATVSTLHSAFGIAAGDGGVWLSNSDANTVTRIDPATDAVVATIPVGHSPAGIAITAGAVWVANHHSGSVMRIDPATNTIVATIPVGQYAATGPIDLAAAGGSVWFDADEASGSMAERLDPATNSVVARVPVPLNSHASFGSDGTSLWLGNLDEGKIYPVDLAANALGTPIAAPELPLILRVGLGSVWSVAPSTGLVRYDPTAGTVTGETPFAASVGLAVDYGAAWVGRIPGNDVLRIVP